MTKPDYPFNFIVFDIETYSPSKLNRIDVNEFRSSVTGVYISWIDEYVAYMEDETEDFLKLLKQADLVIGYNHIWFDLPVLQKYSDYNLLSLPNYDIMVEIEKKVGYKMKLDDVCKANLKDDIKTDSYEVYKHYHWDKKWDKLINYCMNDVRLTTDIFLKILKTGKLQYQDFQDTLEVKLDKPAPGKIAEAPGEMDSIF